VAPSYRGLLLLDGNAALIDLDLDALGLLPLLVELKADDRGNDYERGDDEVESVAIHGPARSKNEEKIGQIAANAP
jgi:hypothetical protein